MHYSSVDVHDRPLVATVVPEITALYPHAHISANYAILLLLLVLSTVCIVLNDKEGLEGI